MERDSYEAMTYLVYNFNEMNNLVDLSNNNNHAGIERLEKSEKAEALMKLVNDYRIYTQRFETLPTWDILEFLNKLDKELNTRYDKEIKDGERDRLKNEYFLLTNKKPFWWWTVEEIKERMEAYREEHNKDLSEYTLDSKKTRWKKIK